METVQRLFQRKGQTVPHDYQVRDDPSAKKLAYDPAEKPARGEPDAQARVLPRKSIGTSTGSTSLRDTPWLVPRVFVTRNPDGTTQRHNASIWERIFITLEHPSESVVGKWISIVVMILIVVSCTGYVIATMPELNRIPDSCSKEEEDCGMVCVGDDTTCTDKVEKCVCEPQPLMVLDLIETVSIMAFTIEYLLRLGTVWAVSLDVAGIARAPAEDSTDDGETSSQEEENLPWWRKMMRYALTFLNLIDIVAILPFYLEMVIPGSPKFGFVRVLRLARIFRIFRLGKFSEGLGLFVRTMSSSMPALSLLLFFNLIGSVLFGSLAYFCERGEWKVTNEYPQGAYMRLDSYTPERTLEPSPFRSIPYAFYWTFVTGTTVGYGEMYPQSGMGKVIAVFCMVAGVLVLALPITVIGSNFTREYALLHGDEDAIVERGSPMGKAGTAKTKRLSVDTHAGGGGALISRKDLENVVRQAVHATTRQLGGASNGEQHRQPQHQQQQGGLAGLARQLDDARRLLDEVSGAIATLQTQDGAGDVSFAAVTRLGDPKSTPSQQGPDLQVEDYKAIEFDQAQPGFAVEDRGRRLQSAASRATNAAKEQAVTSHSSADDELGAQTECGDRMNLPRSGSVSTIPDSSMLVSRNGRGGFSLLLDLDSKTGWTQKLLAAAPRGADGSTDLVVQDHDDRYDDVPTLTEEGETEEDDDECETGDSARSKESKTSELSSELGLQQTNGPPFGKRSSSIIVSEVESSASSSARSNEGNSSGRSAGGTAASVTSSARSAGTGSGLSSSRSGGERSTNIGRGGSTVASTATNSTTPSVVSSSRRSSHSSASCDPNSTSTPTSSSHVPTAAVNRHALSRAVSMFNSSTEGGAAATQQQAQQAQGRAQAQQQAQLQSQGPRDGGGSSLASLLRQMDRGSSSGLPPSSETPIGVNARPHIPEQTVLGVQPTEFKMKGSMKGDMRSIAALAKRRPDPKLSSKAEAQRLEERKLKRALHMKGLRELGKSLRFITRSSLEEIQGGIKAKSAENLGIDSRYLQVTVRSLACLGNIPALAGNKPLIVSMKCGSKIFETKSRTLTGETTSAATAGSSNSHLKVDDTPGPVWDQSFDIRVPVSTHSGKFSVKDLDVKLYAGRNILGVCLVPLSEVTGSDQEFRLLPANSDLVRRRRSSKGNVIAPGTSPGDAMIRLKLEWKTVDSTGHRFGTSLARFLTTGDAFGRTTGPAEDSYREPPAFPTLLDKNDAPSGEAHQYGPGARRFAGLGSAVMAARRMNFALQGSTPSSGGFTELTETVRSKAPPTPSGTAPVSGGVSGSMVKASASTNGSAPHGQAHGGFASAASRIATRGGAVLTVQPVPAPTAERRIVRQESDDVTCTTEEPVSPRGLASPLTPSNLAAHDVKTKAQLLGNRSLNSGEGTSLSNLFATAAMSATTKVRVVEDSVVPGHSSVTILDSAQDKSFQNNSSSDGLSDMDDVPVLELSHPNSKLMLQQFHPGGTSNLFGSPGSGKSR